MPRSATLACLLCLLALSAAAPASAQMDPENPPEPPSERLAELEPFFGLYTHTGQRWAGVGPFSGTLEVRPAVKGWYVEWIIDTHHRAIDRQLRMLVTWDEELERYRVWRFETVPQQPPGTVEAAARFMGDTLVMEWEGVPGPSGRRGTFRNRAYMDGPDELVIISDVLPGGGDERMVLGEWRSQRRM